MQNNDFFIMKNPLIVLSDGLSYRTRIARRDGQKSSCLSAQPVGSWAKLGRKMSRQLSQVYLSLLWMAVLGVELGRISPVALFTWLSTLSILRAPPSYQELSPGSWLCHHVPSWEVSCQTEGRSYWLARTRWLLTWEDPLSKNGRCIGYFSVANT